MAGSFTSVAELRASQLGSLNELLRAILPANPFYARKVAESGAPQNFSSLEEYGADFPFTTKPEIAADQLQTPPFGSNLTFPVELYSRLHQTSGTTGKPLRWLDTAETWSTLIDCWV